MQIRKDGMARRCDVLLQTDAERAIGRAIRKVEEMGAHPDLTAIVVSLSGLKDKVANYVEQPINNSMSDKLLAEISSIKKAME